MDGQLFLIKHLLILREQIAPFDIEFSVTHKELDFSHLLDHLRRIFRGQASLFDWSRSTFLARTLSPRVLESQIDAKKELEKSLKATCEEFIMSVTKLVVDPMLSFVTKVVMLGLDAAGKTTILYKLHIGEVLSTVPTIGLDGLPQPIGQNCMLCKRDLSFTPEGPVHQPTVPPSVAVLPCGHTFHDYCLQTITPEDQSKDPPCIPCAIVVREVWPRYLERINLVEPSQSMQRAGQSLIKNLKNLPQIHSYDSIHSLTKNINKSERDHDLVIASYVLGEIPSQQDRITIVRQLWDLTQDVLVLVEPGTPHRFNIISQMRSYILWMEKRKRRKSKAAIDDTSKDLMTLKSGAFVVAPCAHDGRCPLDNTGKYCHFVQRLQRTTSQRVYKKSKGGKPLRGFEDEKFCFVAFRRGQRPRDPWPLDGMKFDTLKEQHAKRNPEDLEIDYEDQFESEVEDVPYGDNPISYDSDIKEADDDIPEDDDEEEEEENKEETASADLGPGWGRIIEPPVRRGRRVELNVCRAANPDGSEGALERIVVTQSKNPTLHKQARRSFWGDLWPFSMFGLGL